MFQPRGQAQAAGWAVQAEIDVMVSQALTQSGATSIKDMGNVMALLKAPMQGRADMSVVSAKIKAAFAE